MAEMLFFRNDLRQRCDQMRVAARVWRRSAPGLSGRCIRQNLPLVPLEDDQVLVGEKSSLIYTKFRWPSCVSQHTRRKPRGIVPADVEKRLY